MTIQKMIFSRKKKFSKSAFFVILLLILAVSFLFFLYQKISKAAIFLSEENEISESIFYDNNGLKINLNTFNKEVLKNIQGIPKVSNSQTSSEKLIIEIVNHLAEGRLHEAINISNTIVKKYPNYPLGHLIRSDLHRLLLPPNHQSSTWFDNLIYSNGQTLSPIQLELEKRFNALSSLPDSGYLPSNIQAISSFYDHLIVANTSNGRVYVLELDHKNNLSQIKLVHHFFMVIGVMGSDKQVEGDQKTPHGIYHLLSQLSSRNLPDLYGSGALTLNYPNPIDTHLGKTGFGIWFHGTPSNQYVREPLASDGCLVLSNNDMDVLLSTVRPRRTLVIIDDQIDWKNPNNFTSQLNLVEHPVVSQIKTLLLNVQEGNSEAAERFYVNKSSHSISTSNRPIDRLFGVQLGVNGDLQNIKNLTLVDWNKDKKYTLAEFQVQNSVNQRLVNIRQFWVKDENNWLVVHERSF